MKVHDVPRTRAPGRTDPSGAKVAVVWPPVASLVLLAVVIVASCAAMAMLARSADASTLDYGVGIVPIAVPWAVAFLSIIVAVTSLRARWVSTAAGTLLLGALAIATVWSVVMLPFDALRIIGLVPLPMSVGGAGTRLCLLMSASGALVAAQTVRRASQRRCPACRRVLPGPLDRLPRWPAGVAVGAALVYPALRLCWALGGAFGTAGEPLEMDAVVAWAPVVAGAALVVFASILFVGKGPLLVRGLLGLGGVLAGSLLAMAGGLGAIKAATDLATDGPLSVLPGSDLMTWTFVVVYGSWFVAGVGVAIGGWRYWAHRRDDCPTCSQLMETS